MRTIRLAPVLAAGLLALGALVTAPTAAASTPADCTVVKQGTSTVSITCTNRPATATWRTHIPACHSGWVDSSAFGNIVTGNGTSTATCPLNSHALPGSHYLAV